MVDNYSCQRLHGHINVRCHRSRPYNDDREKGSAKRDRLFEVYAHYVCLQYEYAKKCAE